MFTLTVTDTGGLTGQDVVSVTVITNPYRNGAVCDLCDGVDGGRGRDCRGDFNRH